MFSGLGERYICPSRDSTKLLGESQEIAEATHLSVSTVGSTRISSILDGGLPTGRGGVITRWIVLTVRLREKSWLSQAGKRVSMEPISAAD